MASLSQALRLGDLPPPHRPFQGHAPHIIEWSIMLRPNDSWSTCILQGIATFLHYASRRSAGYRYTTRYAPTATFTPASRRQKGADAQQALPLRLLGIHAAVVTLYFGGLWLAWNR